MPSERDYKAPEEVLIPGVGVFMTMGHPYPASSHGPFRGPPLRLGMGSNWMMVELASRGSWSTTALRCS